MRTLFVFVILCGSTFAAPPTPEPPVAPVAAKSVRITGPASPVMLGKTPIIIKVETTARRVSWRPFQAGISVVMVTTKELHVWADPGMYTFGCSVGTSVEGDAIHAVDFVLTVQGAQPPPKPPGPIDPPAPNPAPIPGPGLKMLLVYQDSELAALPSAQAQIPFAKAVRDYLRSKGADNFRIWDANVDATGDLQIWRDAFARKRESVPWIVISNGKTGFEGPLPKTVADTIKLLKQYGE